MRHDLDTSNTEFSLIYKVGFYFFLLFIVLLIVGAFFVPEREKPTRDKDYRLRKWQQQQATLEANNRVLDAKLSSIMSDGDGNAFLNLSNQDQMKLCKKIELTLSDANVGISDYYTFLHTFYGKAQRDHNESHLSKKISETVAVGTAMMSNK